MEEIKNKRISRDKIKQIAEMLKERFDKFYKLYEEYTREISDYRSPENKKIKDIVVYYKPTLSFDIKLTEDSETTSDFDLFIDYLTRYYKSIESLRISFNSFYYKNASNSDHFNSPKIEEDFYITFREDNIYYSCHHENASGTFFNLVNNIKDIINSSPPRYDDTIRKRNLRENFPSEIIALPIGFTLTLFLFLFCKFANINIYINFLILTPYFPFVMLVVTLLLGLIIPGKNHALYRKIKIKQQYVGYNSSTHTNIYKDDIRDFKSVCEIEIGKYSDYGDIRNQIETNYKKSKLIFWIELAVFLAACFAMAILTII